jgi:predicted tellurium resistance membrane protein TerC
MLGSAIIIKLINRFPVIIYIGAGLIAYTAGKMIVADQAIQPYLPKLLIGNEYLAIILTVVVTAYGWMHKKKEAGLLENTAAAEE